MKESLTWENEIPETEVKWPAREKTYHSAEPQKHSVYWCYTLDPLKYVAMLILGIGLGHPYIFYCGSDIMARLQRKYKERINGNIIKKATKRPCPWQTLKFHCRTCTGITNNSNHGSVSLRSSMHNTRPSMEHINGITSLWMLLITPLLLFLLWHWKMKRVYPPIGTVYYLKIEH